MNPMVVKRFKEKSIEASKAKFSWGVKNGAALAALLPDFRFVEEHSLCEGMAEFAQVYKLLGKIPAVSNIQSPARRKFGRRSRTTIRNRSAKPSGSACRCSMSTF